ncbi:MAG TPA: DEAD/DEAH box helicase [Candidatus Saccharimonadales bacterium]|nr:DEAD/DEAH box helicase [Candidatus Saccharimonadales bacterium]
MPYNSRTAGRKYGVRTAYHAVPKRRSQRSKGPKKDYIHPSRFVKTATPIEDVVYAPTHRFDDFAVHPLLQRNIAAKGFEKPSPVQDQAIPFGLEGRDVIGIANTGTGKTVAFAVPVLNRLLESNGAGVLVIAPTRELAQQIEDEFRALARQSGLYGALLIGGTTMGPQLRDLRAKPQIIIGTPGRIKDHLERGSLDLTGCDMVVLDEVDRMLDMGFVEDVSDILGKLASERQSFFFSATMDRKVRDLITFFSNDPVTVSVSNGATTDNVHQDIVCYESPRDKMEQLHLLLNKNIDKAIIFDDTQRDVERLANDLIARGFKADAIHGGKSQNQRQRALNRFKKSEITILVATDVAARGIDVADITHVINYSTPQNFETYTHRIGRAGRAGRIGHALTFITE